MGIGNQLQYGTYKRYQNVQQAADTYTIGGGDTGIFLPTVRWDIFCDNKLGRSYVRSRTNAE